MTDRISVVDDAYHDGYRDAWRAAIALAEREAQRKAPLGGAIAAIGEGALQDFADLLREEYPHGHL